MKEFSASPSDIGMRADIFIAKKYPQFTRSSLEGLFAQNKVTTDSRPIKPSYRIRPDDKLRVDEAMITDKPEAVDLPVIYQDDDVIVINKPAGVLTHSKGALNLEPTVASFIANSITDKQLTGNRAGIVHRLDRPTSGVIICARNLPAQKWLQRQFAERKTEKTYLSIVEGIPEPTEALIDIPIGRNPKKPQTFKAMPSGKKAQTHLLVKDKYVINKAEYSLVELKPQTGRTHQIRVHLAYIGHPVVGDVVYGHKSSWPLLLHAHKLSLILPNKQNKTFSAPPPRIFKEFAAHEPD
jgi:23S rRNA pseudouridine1911/1915/1917 synthase